MKTKIFNFIQNLLFILSIIICVFILAQKFIFKQNGIFGYRTFVIITSSMKPSLEVGDVIIVKKTDPNILKEGDIITYQGTESDFKGKIVTHLIKTIDKDNKGTLLFYTKGTVTNMIDPVVKQEQIYGKMVYRFFLISLVSKIIRSKIGFFLVIFIPLIIILVKQLLNIKKEVKKDMLAEITNEQIKTYKKSHKKKFKIFKNKKENNTIVSVKESNDELEKTIYSKEFKKDIQDELEKTMVNINLRQEIENKLEEEKVQKPSRGLESTLIDSTLVEEIKKEEEKVPSIIYIED